MMIPTLKLKAARTAQVAASRLQSSAAEAELNKVVKLVRDEARAKLAAIKCVSADTQDLVSTLETAGATPEEVTRVTNEINRVTARLNEGKDRVEAAAYPKKVAKAKAKAARLETATA